MQASIKLFVVKLKADTKVYFLFSEVEVLALLAGNSTTFKAVLSAL